MSRRCKEVNFVLGSVDYVQQLGRYVEEDVARDDIPISGENVCT